MYSSPTTANWFVCEHMYFHHNRDRESLLSPFVFECLPGKVVANMKLYGVCDGPPTLVCQLALKALKKDYELIMVDYCKGEFLTEDYAKMNPSKEIPVLDDDGFFLGESIAIMQYLFDKYGPADSPFYPKEAKARAIVNHRMLFNTCNYYAAISAYAMAPMFWAYPRNEGGLKRVKIALDTFETYMRQINSKYVAGDHVTLGDFSMISATICLEGIKFDLSPWPLVKQWYETFKAEQTEFWPICQETLKWIVHFENNTPDMSQCDHPLHPKKV